MKTLFSLLSIFLILFVTGLSAQSRQISGKVTDEKGNPLIGVTVQVKGTAVGTFTKTDGSYRLTAPAGARILVFRLLGMKVKEVAIGTNDVINASLEEDKIAMEEVVVTAIGLEREKKSIGYAFEEVSGKIIEESRSVNVVNALTGKIAGVQVNSSTGMPGASSFIRIRGSSSITGSNQPLFIVDGIPIDNSQIYSGNPDDGDNNLLFSVAYSNRAIDLNPEDVESISVLKGPAATALYGLRAAGGAIIITTKKGTAGVGEPVNISFHYSKTFEEVNKLPELQMKWSQGIDGQFVQPGSTQALSWGALIDTLRYTGETNRFDKNGNITGASDPKGIKQVVPYDNLNNFFITGMTDNFGFNMAGGTDFGNFYLSASHLASEGIVPNSQFKRTTARITGEARISSYVKASGTMNYINSGGTRIQQGSNVSGVMLGLLRTPPTFDNSNGYGQDAYKHEDAYMFLPAGTQRTYRGGGGYDNPYWTVMRNPLFDNVERFIGNFQLNFYVTDWFDILWRLGGDIYSDVRKQEFSLYSRTVPSGRVFNHDLTNSDITSDLILGFNHKLTDDLFGKLLIGTNIYQSSYHSIYVQGDGLIVPNFYHISNTTGQIVRESKEKLRRMAIYGDLTLDYQSMLFFNLALRNEWSTTLPEENNSFLFGTGNVSFIFTEAFKDIFKYSILSYGQLKANLAIVGKDAPMYGTLTQWAQASYGDGWTDGISFPFGGFVGYAYGDVLGNDELKPETTTSWEIGLNLNFYDNLFGIDFTYYNSRSYDQIFLVPIATSSGYFRQVKNAGEITNKGIEAILTVNPIRDDNFKWDFSLNFSKNENTVEKLAPGVDNIFLGGFVGASVRAVAGQPYGSIYGFGWQRDEQGRVKIGDDPENEAEYGFPIVDRAEKNFGSATPDWLFGFRNNLSYAGLTLSFLIDVKKGGVLWNGTKGALYFFGTHKETENRNYKKVFEGVKATSGAVNDIEVTIDQGWLALGNGNGFFGNNTEDFIEDAGWVRLREVSLSYNLPKDISKMLFVSDITVSFTARNLWLSTDYTGIDPETSLMGTVNAQGIDYFNMPNTRSYNFTVNLGF